MRTGGLVGGVSDVDGVEATAPEVAGVVVEGAEVEGDPTDGAVVVAEVCPAVAAA